MSDDNQMMRSIAQALDSVLNGPVLPKKVGFVCLVFPFDQLENGGVNYVSNGKREDVLIALKEVVARFEGRVQKSEGIQ